MIIRLILFLLLFVGCGSSNSGQITEYGWSDWPDEWTSCQSVEDCMMISGPCICEYCAVNREFEQAVRNYESRQSRPPQPIPDICDAETILCSSGRCRLEWRDVPVEPDGT